MSAEEGQTGKLEFMKWFVVAVALPLMAAVHGFWSKEREMAVAEKQSAMQKWEKLMPLAISEKPLERKAVRHFLEAEKNDVYLNQTLLPLIRASEGVATASRSMATDEKKLEIASELEAASLVSSEKREHPESTLPEQVAAPTDGASEIDLPRIVFIQIYCEEDRPLAASLQELLRGAGIGAPGIENVLRGKNKDVHERTQTGSFLSVRYFNRNDQPLANALAGLVAKGEDEQKLQGLPLQLGYVNLGEKVKIRTGQLEIWFPNRQQCTV